jgi:hypothetical protein
MPLIAEDGTGRADAESYVSVANADAYHSNFGNTTWTGADPLKEAALRRATRYIDGFYRLQWKGYRRMSTQALEWPRVEVYDPSGWYVASDAVPVVVKQATCEAALRELVLPGALNPDLERGGAIKAESVDVISVVYADGATPRTVFTTLSDLLNGLTCGATIRLRR